MRRCSSGVCGPSLRPRLPASRLVEAEACRATGCHAAEARGASAPQPHDDGVDGGGGAAAARRRGAGGDACQHPHHPGRLLPEVRLRARSRTQGGSSSSQLSACTSRHGGPLWGPLVSRRGLLGPHRSRRPPFRRPPVSLRCAGTSWELAHAAPPPCHTHSRLRYFEPLAAAELWALLSPAVRDVGHSYAEAFEALGWLALFAPTNNIGRCAC